MCEKSCFFGYYCYYCRYCHYCHYNDYCHNCHYCHYCQSLLSLLSLLSHRLERRWVLVTIWYSYSHNFTNIPGPTDRPTDRPTTILLELLWAAKKIKCLDHGFKNLVRISNFRSPVMKKGWWGGIFFVCFLFFCA